MTDMYDEKKVPEFTLPPYQHEDHGSEVCSNVLNKYVFLKCECVRGGGGVLNGGYIIVFRDDVCVCGIGGG